MKKNAYLKFGRPNLQIYIYIYILKHLVFHEALSNLF